ncbi:MAG TPA: hypothetical protein VEV65_05910 [Kineosporiaceae bacterium]|nr:hypothetical protein [Kineosporiaceae bacterium]
MTDPMPPGAAGPVADTGPGAAPVAAPVAPRSRRLVLAYGYVLGVAVAAASALALRGTATAVLQLAGLVVMVVTWFALRRATRLVVDAPAAHLADRLVRLRDRLFVLAYQLLAVVAVLVSAVLFVGSSGGLSEPVASALAWAAFGSALGLPLVVAAVSLPDDAASL